MGEYYDLKDDWYMIIIEHKYEIEETGMGAQFRVDFMMSMRDATEQDRWWKNIIMYGQFGRLDLPVILVGL